MLLVKTENPAGIYRFGGRSLALLIVAVAAGLAGRSASASDTRSYVVGWFTQAAYSQDGDCPNGMNLELTEQYAKDLAVLGKTPEEIETLIKEWGGVQGGPHSIAMHDLMVNRGRINGKPVNAYANPAAVADPHLTSVVGKYAYGFNLDGKGAASTNSFEDPETHEVGVNNQVFRTLGCILTFRGTKADRPSYWGWIWTMMKDSMPAWLITISGEDLNRDGDVAITFDRALEHLTSNVDGEPRADMTFRIDPSPRSHRVFNGRIKAGVISISEPGSLHLIEDALLFPDFDLQNTHLRLTMGADGSLDGILGGYQPWHQVYFGFAEGGWGLESALGFDLPGVYHLLKKMADADPDPMTGQNMSISVAYRIEAVPAFVVQAPENERGEVAAR